MVYNQSKFNEAAGAKNYKDYSLQILKPVTVNLSLLIFADNPNEMYQLIKLINGVKMFM